MAIRTTDLFLGICPNVNTPFQTLCISEKDLATLRESERKKERVSE